MLVLLKNYQVFSRYLSHFLIPRELKNRKNGKFCDSNLTRLNGHQYIYIYIYLEIPRLLQIPVKILIRDDQLGSLQKSRLVLENHQVSVFYSMEDDQLHSLLNFFFLIAFYVFKMS